MLSNKTQPFYDLAVAYFSLVDTNKIERAPLSSTSEKLECFQVRQVRKGL